MVKRGCGYDFEGALLYFQGLKLEVIPSGYEENLDKSLFKHPHEYVLETAKHKTLEVAERLKNDKVSFLTMNYQNSSIEIIQA